MKHVSKWLKTAGRLIADGPYSLQETDSAREEGLREARAQADYRADVAAGRRR